MTEKTLFSTEDAARYLKLSVRTIKYHIYETKQLKGQLIGNSLVFTKAELDEFNRNRQPVGRPKTKKESK